MKIKLNRLVEQKASFILFLHVSLIYVQKTKTFQKKTLCVCGWAGVRACVRTESDIYYNVLNLVIVHELVLESWQCVMFVHFLKYLLFF